jgi:hypothetical protein
MIAATCPIAAGTRWAAPNAATAASIAAVLGGDAVCPLETASVHPVVPRRAEARRELGLDPNAKVALVFGSKHASQMPDVAFEALQARPDWQLIVGGRLCELLDPDSAARWPRAPMLFPGHVSDGVREALFEAADAIVIAISPEFQQDSGIFTDALSHRRPLVASQGSIPGRRVEELGLGETFAIDSAVSLLEALDRLEVGDYDHAISIARQRFSAVGLATSHLDLLSEIRRASRERSTAQGDGGRPNLQRLAGRRLARGLHPRRRGRGRQR